MLLSLTHNYLFIANQKVASESLHLIAGDDAELGFSRIGSDKHCQFDELAVMLAEADVEVDFSPMFVFSIVREPAEWYVSWYNSRARPGLANPDHRRHKVYTGTTGFDDFLKAALARPRAPMTKVKAQRPFFAPVGDKMVIPLPFDRINDVFTRLFPAAASISEFRLFKPEHHKNQSRVVRFTTADLTDEHREIINTQIYPDDYLLYREALAAVDAIDPIVATSADADRAAHLTDRLHSDATLSSLAYEAAFAQAQTRLYRGDDAAEVEADIRRYRHIDHDELLGSVNNRVSRMRQ